MKIWVVGPIAWDSVLFLENSFADSGYTHIRKQTERPGGQGLNVAVGLQSSGKDVSLVGYLGNCENAQKLSSAMDQLNISQEFLQNFPAPSPHIMVLVDNLGERKMIGLEKSFLHDVRLPLEQISLDDIVVWTWWRDDFENDFLHCKAIGAKTIMGLTGLANPKIDADLYIGSSEELSIAEIPTNKKVIVTNGVFGAKYHCDGDVQDVAAKEVSVVDATGAGDALLAGVIYGIANRLTHLESLKIGVNWASATIANESSLPTNWSDKYIELAR